MGIVNFKYERLSTFCFVCGMLGHSERKCGVVYANPDAVIELAYGTWLRAPPRSARIQNIGARWLRNGGDGGQTWTHNTSAPASSSTVHTVAHSVAIFMEIDGRLSEIGGKEGRIYLVQHGQRDTEYPNIPANQGADLVGGYLTAKDTTIVLDSKRKRVNKVNRLTHDGLFHNGPEDMSANTTNVGSKNLLEAGPVDQARLAH